VDRPKTPELSDVLARLSMQAKTVEGAFADLADKTDAAAAKRDERVQADWRAMQASIDKQVKVIQADMDARKHELDMNAAEQHAEAAKARADWAASYAVAASEMARMAALDAEAARHEANALKRQ
jgi:hypothetical protein